MYAHQDADRQLTAPQSGNTVTAAFNGYNGTPQQLPPRR